MKPLDKVLRVENQFNQIVAEAIGQILINYNDYIETVEKNYKLERFFHECGTNELERIKFDKEYIKLMETILDNRKRDEEILKDFPSLLQYLKGFLKEINVLPEKAMAKVSFSFNGDFYKVKNNFEIIQNEHKDLLDHYYQLRAKVFRVFLSKENSKENDILREMYTKISEVIEETKKTRKLLDDLERKFKSLEEDMVNEY